MEFYNNNRTFCFLMLTIISFLLFSAGFSHQVMGQEQPGVQAACDEGPVNPPSSETENLETAEDWGIYCENTSNWIKETVSSPALSDTALRCSLAGGDPYSNIHCYRNFVAEPDSTSFELSLSFWFSSTTCNNQGASSLVQALEFSISKWEASQRYEIALQWQNVGEGAPQWRYWDASQPEPWVPIQVDNGDLCLQGSKWHTLTMNGEIIDGQVHYQSFTLDGQTQVLDISVPPVSDDVEDKLAIAVQLDGNSTGIPYDVFIDNVTFTRSTVGVPEIMIIAPTANLRSCASQTCTTITSISEGKTIPFVGTNENGECINGNCVWYKTTYFGADAFIHSSVASISGSTPSSPSTICSPTGDNAVDVLFNVPEGYKAYIGSDGIGISPQNMKYGGYLTTITGPFEGTLRVHNGIYCGEVVIGSVDETFARNTTQKACAACTSLELPRDIAVFGEVVDNNGVVQPTIAPTSTVSASSELPFNCINTGAKTDEVLFSVPEGYIATINSDGIGTNPESMIYGGYSIIITDPFERTLRVHNGVYCMVAAIGSANETIARNRMQQACAGRVCTPLNLPQDIARIGG